MKVKKGMRLFLLEFNNVKRKENSRHRHSSQKHTPYCIHSVLNGVILKFGQIKS